MVQATILNARGNCPIGFHGGPFWTFMLAYGELDKKIKCGLVQMDRRRYKAFRACKPPLSTPQEWWRLFTMPGNLHSKGERFQPSGIVPELCQIGWNWHCMVCQSNSSCFSYKAHNRLSGLLGNKVWWGTWGCRTTALDVCRFSKLGRRHSPEKLHTVCSFMHWRCCVALQRLSAQDDPRRRFPFSCKYS